MKHLGCLILVTLDFHMLIFSLAHFMNLLLFIKDLEEKGQNRNLPPARVLLNKRRNTL